MNKLFSSFVTIVFIITVLSSCSNKLPEFTQTAPFVQTQVSTFNNVEVPEFSKRKLGSMNIPTNSINQQKINQVKLHTYYFNSYSNGSAYYSGSDTNGRNANNVLRD